MFPADQKDSKNPTHSLINPLSIRREVVLQDTNHIKNPFDKALHLNQLYYQLNQHHPAIPANKARHRTSLANLHTFPFLHQVLLVIRRKVKVTIATLIAEVAMFQFLMHQAVEVCHLDTYPKIQPHLLEVSEVMLDSVGDIPLQVNVKSKLVEEQKINYFNRRWFRLWFFGSTRNRFVRITNQQRLKSIYVRIRTIS